MIKRPDLSGAKLLVIDVETKDPLLTEKGNGVFRNDGYLLGVGISDGTFKEYYNLGHPGITMEEKVANERYIEEVLLLDIPKLGTNFLYDIDWLQNWAGWKVNGKWNDIIIAESLIDEYRSSYSLDSLAEKYLGEHKRNEKTVQFCIDNRLPVKKKGHERKWLWKMPYELVRDYVLGDVDQPFRIFEKQQVFLKKEHMFKKNGRWEPQTLEEIYDIEVRSQPMLMLMRKTGVRVDKERLIHTGIQVTDILYHLDNEILTLANSKSFNPNSKIDMTKLSKLHGIPIAYNEPTEKMKEKGLTRGNPCFDKERLSSLEGAYPVISKILERRHYGTIMSFFIKPYPGMLVDGRLHCNFYPTKRDEGGTVTGRFSSSNPNLQQVSSKKEDSENAFLRGKIIRSCFIPEEWGHWMKNDWSQIEYRLIAHYAIGEGADEIRRRYTESLDTDYHAETGEMTGLITDVNDEDQRKVTKTLNFGTAYGMGANSMSRKYGWDLDYAHEVFNLYHNKLPFVKQTGTAVGLAAKQRGYIKTVLGRHCHVPPSRKYYVMFNRLIQGSAADIMKAAMVQAYESGIFKEGVLMPHLTVHDEMDSSIASSKEGIEAGRELTRIMENCVTLKVPIKCDSEVGENWGNVMDFEKWAKHYE